jgi:hypothetical protein
MSVYHQMMMQLHEQELAKQAAMSEAADTEALFDAAFEAHTAKLAALDPAYAAMLHAEQEKAAAFEAAYYTTLQALGG